MANFISNTITFPSRTDFDSFIDSYGGGLDLEKGTACFSFGWIIKNPELWGVKRDVNDSEHSWFSPENNSIYFDSAWNVPWPVYEAMAGLGLEFSFSWQSEPGAGSSGFGHVSEGKVTVDKESYGDEHSGIGGEEKPVAGEKRTEFCGDLSSTEKREDILPPDLPF